MYVMSGMGDVLNCPGDPGCPGYVAPTLNCPGDPGCPGNPAPGATTDQLQAEIDALFAYTQAGQQGGQSDAGMSPGTSFTSWLNANGTMLALAGAGLFGVILLAKAAR